MTTVKLDESATVTLDGAGNGTARVGPISAREVWHPAMVHVSANRAPVNEAQCLVFMGDLPIRTNYRDGTFSGSSGDSTDSFKSDIVKLGQYIIAQWTGGDPGQIATLTVTGEKEV